jgi:PncC family amidohydrolase
MTSVMKSENLSALIEKLRKRNQTIGFAESCTGGLLSSRMTMNAGVSDVFVGSVVSYANSVKENLLGVSRNVLRLEGAVSERVARQMAQGLRTQMKCDWSIAITGIAGPTGGTPEKPVGTVWFAAAGPGVELTSRQIFSGNREKIQSQAAEFAVQLLLKALE